ncbi:T9SS type A sorting domain-containing protein [bacterium]|nr:T9SS type A sorting domain-containing protein [bacterium]
MNAKRLSFFAGLLFLGFFCAPALWAQKPTEHLLDAIAFPQRAAQGSGSAEYIATVDTLNLPFADDFSDREGPPNAQRWVDAKVWINNTYGRDIPTLGVASFDGLDENGLAYDLADNSSDTLADVLTSAPIRLNPAMANVRLSFEFQAGGRGEAPEANDRLVVEFYAPSDSSWTEVWSANGPGFDGFKSAIVEVDSAIWRVPGFQFRFGAYGARSGSFDVWNLDYVQLGTNRPADDTLFVDAGFTREHPSLINGYHEVPWDHISSGPNRFVSQFGLHYRKNGPPGSASINLGRYVIEQDGGVLATKNGNPDNAPPYNVENLRTVLVDPFAINPPTGPFTLTIRSIMDGANDGFRTNDTVEKIHRFERHYALDDGSAERVYGLSNTPGARTAVAFAPFRADSLKGLQILFVPTQFDARLNSFRIGIWEYNAGVPGNLIYLSDSLYKPAYYGQERPISYALDTSALFISGPFFAGVVQTTVNPLNIGLDVNQPDSDTTSSIFYGDAANWYSSLFPGRLILRPYFAEQPADLGAEPLRSRQVLQIYPNPATYRTRLELPFEGEWQIDWIDLQGRILDQGVLRTAEDWDVSRLSRGLYFVRAIELHTGQIWSTSLIKN